MLRKITLVVLAGVLMVQLSACGTLFWKERIGKASSDQIDPTVMILDCCGLLFGIIPGVIALVLDFNNKTIYFSKGEPGATAMDKMDRSDMIAIKVDKMDRKSIEAALSKELGRSVDLSEMQILAAN